MTDIEQTTLELCSALAEEPAALLPMLHALQRHYGYIPADAEACVAHLLNLSRAEVHGVVSFYDMFRTRPGGRTTLYLCRAEACRASGGEALEAAAKARLGIDYHQASDDNCLQLEPVYCLGNCACGPSVMLGERLYSRVTPESLDAIIRHAKEVGE